MILQIKIEFNIYANFKWKTNTRENVIIVLNVVQSNKWFISYCHYIFMLLQILFTSAYYKVEIKAIKYLQLQIKQLEL